MNARGLIVDNVSWGPKVKGPLILHPLSFALNAGKVLGVVGANGAGKSTLLRLLYRYNRPRSGSIRIGSDDLWKLRPKEAARKVAAVLQEQPTDFALTVRDIVALGRTPHHAGFSGSSAKDASMIDAALERLDLRSFASRRFGTLSGGERQRVMVARALAQDPELLILDEPTNHLDIRHQLEILALIKDLNLTIVTSLHDLNMAADVCDDILMLQRGHMVGFGTPSNVLCEKLVSSSFSVSACLEHLNVSDRTHLTFHLPS
nr:ABC transporter ATP-binding protein [uncultured Cohaesibacter sp.]